MFKAPFKNVVKRDGRILPFDQSRITNAVARAMQEIGEGNLEKDPTKISDWVLQELVKHCPPHHNPHIEEIQDMVEEVLILRDFPKTAKHYILYRQERARVRDKKKLVPERVKELVSQSKKYFRNSLSEFIYYRSYSRWIEEEGRRETWIETVERYLNFMKENLGSRLRDDEYQKIQDAILKQDIMPSMRLVWAAGKAARATNVTAYNCSYIAPKQIRDFAEIMYLSMCGAGVGFSVESQTIQQLPIIRHQTGEVLSDYIIEDSKEGWGDALTVGMTAWYNGKNIKFDFSKLRPAGDRLRTMGGKSSGPEPLQSLLEFTRMKILSKQGKRLSSIDAHDIICKIGELVVMGGVRRTALISLSDLDDPEVRDAKKGQFYIDHPYRAMANNSAVYLERPSSTQFLEEWLSLAKSGSGERGIFNRGGLKAQLPERRWKNFERHYQNSGTNPCGEIILRSKEFCNLTEVVARSEDTEETLLKKIELATILGTYQSMMTDFPYLSKEWKRNCEEERLLGVSITGQWDCKVVRNRSTLRKLRERSLEVNKNYARRFGINPSVAITCVKPSGTVSLLVDASSGMHSRYSPYYIRRVRISATDSLFQMLRDQKFPFIHPEVGQTEDKATTFVLEFPVAAPNGSIFRNDVTAIEQLEHWKMVKENYTEHNPSVTVTVDDDEWIKTSHWLYENWDILGGLSFLPKQKHVYRLAPLEEITEERYKEMVSQLPEIDFSQIIVYEKDDETQGAKEAACVGGVCEIDPEEGSVAAVSPSRVLVSE